MKNISKILLTSVLAVTGFTTFASHVSASELNISASGTVGESCSFNDTSDNPITSINLTRISS